MNNQDALKLDFIVAKSDNDTRKRRACVMCAKAHLGCDGKRPCARCISRGYPASCRENDAKKKISISATSKRPKRHKRNLEEDIEDTSDESYTEKLERDNEGGDVGSSQLRTFYIPPTPSQTLYPIDQTHTSSTKQTNINMPNASNSLEPYFIPARVSNNPIPIDEMYSYSRQQHPDNRTTSSHLQQDSQSVSQAHKINFLVQEKNSPYPEKGATNTDINELLNQLEYVLKQEMKSIRDDLKQTQHQQTQINHTLSQIQKQIQDLFLVNQQAVSNKPSESAVAVWNSRNLHLLSNNSFFEQFLNCKKEDLRDITFWRLIPEFFVPVADGMIKSITQNAEVSNPSTVTHIMAFCLSKKLEDVIYAEVNCTPQFDSNGILDTIFMNIRPLT